MQRGRERECASSCVHSANNAQTSQYERERGRERETELIFFTSIQQQAMACADEFVYMSRSFAQLFDDAHGAMRTFVWHKDQKAVSALILAICTKA